MTTINQTVNRKYTFTVLPASSSSSAEATDDEDGVLTIHLIRHGEGYHNVLAAEAIAAGDCDKPPYHISNYAMQPTMIDAPLTGIGRGEAIANRLKTRDLDEQPELMVCSTLRRACDTGLLAFSHLFPFVGDESGEEVALDREGFLGIDPQIPIVAHDGCRESYHSSNLCDRRRPITKFKEEYPYIEVRPGLVDHRLVTDYTDEEVYGLKAAEHIGIDGENCDTLVDRCYDFMVSLTQDIMPSSKKGGVKCAAVATHSVWLFGLTYGVLKFEAEGDEGGKERIQIFKTGEMRSFRIRVTKNKEEEV
jgi:hypothetical protein